MIFDITRLNNNIDQFIEIDEKYSFSKEQLQGTDLLKLDNVSIKGQIFKNSLGNIELELNVVGNMVLPCAITLKPVDYPFNIEINGDLDELFEEKSKKFQNTIDILPIICSVLYSLIIVQSKEKIIRILSLINIILWLIYDFYFLAYVAAISDILVVVSTLIGMYRFDFKKN